MINMETYYARSANPQGEKETVQHHILRSAALCRQFLSVCGYPNLGEDIGLFHDFGKISPLFQQVLEGNAQRVNHALPGAVAAYACVRSKDARAAGMIASVIASHHSELQSFAYYKGHLDLLAQASKKAFDEEGRAVSLCGAAAYKTAQLYWKSFTSLKVPEALPDFSKSEDELLSKMLFERILFSALVDADWSSAAEHDDPDYMTRHSGAILDAEDALRQVIAVRAEKQCNSSSASSLNVLRDTLFDACLAAGQCPRGLFSLTAPTGLGKTLALFAFAAQHALHHKMRRMIIVLPFLSIIEQNSREYRRLVPELLEIHSNVQWSQADAQLAERWDAPCIVTTAVSFFEPLFSARRADCRHLHQLTGSVIVLDEAQALPPQLLEATLRTIKLLVNDYHCSVVFSTATQTSFEFLHGMLWQPVEIAPSPARMFAALRRVTWEWRVEQAAPLSVIAAEASADRQCLIIVNMKRHAQQLMEALSDDCAEDELFYLTTDLCPAHRSDVLERVRSRLAEGRPCRLVATQCIEAGVDIDFPVLYRALAPLDALIQAAGRCNRNGDTPAGRVIVFLPDAQGKLYPTEQYQRAADCVLTLLEKHPIDCNNTSHIRAYYQLLYSYAEGDSAKLKKAIAEEDYPAVRNAYQMIEPGTVQVIVPYAPQEALYEKIRTSIDQNGLTAEVLELAKPLTVASYQRKEAEANCQGLCLRSRTEEQFEKQFFLLGKHELYDTMTGLDLRKADESIY